MPWHHPACVYMCICVSVCLRVCVCVCVWSSQVQVGDSKPMFVVVVGHTDYRGRGLLVHSSLANAKRGPGGPLRCHCLQFKKAELHVFDDLNDQAELNLPLAEEPMGTPSQFL